MSIQIHGKEYVLVNERIMEFHEKYPNGSIETKIEYPDPETVRCEAIIRPDVTTSRMFFGHAEENRKSSQINRTSAVENCETSAVGRALAMLGIGILNSVASAEEVVGAIAQSEPFPGQPQYDTDEQQYRKEVGIVYKHTCPLCGSKHNGRYPKCINCYNKAKQTT